MQGLFKKIQNFSKYIMANLMFVITNLIPIVVLNIYGLEFLLSLKIGILLWGFILGPSLIALFYSVREMYSKDYNFSFVGFYNEFKKSLMPHGLVSMGYILIMLMFSFNATLFKTTSMKFVYVIFIILMIIVYAAFLNYLTLASRYETPWKINVVNSFKALIMYLPLSLTHLIFTLVIFFMIQAIPLLSNVFVYVLFAYLNIRSWEKAFEVIESGF